MYSAVSVALVKHTCVGGVKHETTPLDIAFQEKVSLPAGGGGGGYFAILEESFDGQLGVGLVRECGKAGTLAYKSGDCFRLLLCLLPFACYKPKGSLLCFS